MVARRSALHEPPAPGLQSNGTQLRWPSSGRVGGIALPRMRGGKVRSGSRGRVRDDRESSRRGDGVEEKAAARPQGRTVQLSRVDV